MGYANIYLYLNHMACVRSVMPPLVPTPDDDMMVVMVVMIFTEEKESTSRLSVICISLV